MWHSCVWLHTIFRWNKISSKRLGKLAVGYVSEGCVVPEVVSLFKFWLVRSAKEGNKTTGLETYSVFQSVATWFEYLYSPEQYLLGYHVREKVKVYGKESFLIPRQARSMEWIVLETERAIVNSSSVHIASHVEMCICDFINTHKHSQWDIFTRNVWA